MAENAASLRKSVAVSLLFTLLRTGHSAGAGAVVGGHGFICLKTSRAAGLILLLESIWRFIVVGGGTLMPAVPAEHLVAGGLYRYVRNPMYVGVLTVIVDKALLLRSRSVALELAVVLAGMELFVGFYEERWAGANVSRGV